MRERGAPARGGGVAGESVIAFLFLLSAPLAEAREFPDARSCPRLPGANAEETRKQCNELTREQLLALPTAEFCEVATKKRTLSHDLQTTDSIEEYEAKFYTPKEYMWEAPWKLAMYPHSRTRSAALDGAVAIAQWEGSQEDLVKFLSKPGTILSTFPDKNRLGVYQKRNLQRTNVQQIEQAQAQKAVVCSQYGMANTINCVHSLDTMLAMMSPRDNGDTLVELMIEVFTDPRYVEPARLAAKKVLARVRRDLPEREGDLFGDILAAFVESGVPTPEAEEMAWKFLAMTQVHGVDSPMFLRDLTTKANSPILIATAVIGAGEYILDGRRVKSGHLYSYPPNVRSHCDFGKAYHFWIAAYLSRALAKSSGNGDAAAAAAWITHLGYQMRGSFGSRDPRRPFTEDVYGVTNNGVRMDLAYAAAGARFGVQSAAGISKGLDIDEALRELLRHADPTLAPMSKSEAGDQYSGTGISGYRRFHQLFAPDKAFESFPR